MVLCSLAEVDLQFGGVYCAVMMEAVCTSETSVYFQTKQRYIAEGCHLHTHHCENLKSHKLQAAAFKLRNVCTTLTILACSPKFDLCKWCQ
jgi:hypothetical protein